MATISIGIICQENEAIIRDCLESAKWADEIVVVDAFSKDMTVEIAREYTDKVYQRKVDRHLNEQWNKTIEYSASDWVFSLSTDQRFTPQLAEEIRTVIQREDNKAFYYVPLENYFLGRWIQHCGWSPDYNILLFRRDKGVYSDKEGGLLMIKGEYGYIKNRLIHYSHTDISRTISKINMISTREAEYFLQTKASFRKRFIMTKPFRNFRKTYLKQKGYKDGMHGLAFCLVFSFNRFLMYVKYLEMIRKQKDSAYVAEDFDRVTEEKNVYTSKEAQRLLKEQRVLSEQKIRYEMTVVPLRLFLRDYFLKLGFFQGVRGLIRCILDSYIHAIIWAKYWEMCYVSKIKD